MNITTWGDRSLSYKSRISILTNSAIIGLLLVFVLLLVFLGPWVSLWVLFGLPVAYMGTIWLMPLFSVSLTMISMFAMVLAIGIVVDDAIIISESIVAKFERDNHATIAGAVEGTKVVALPVLVAALTTMLAFIPITFIPGYYGHLAVSVPIIVILAIGFSLLEAMFVLPTHIVQGSSVTENQAHGRLTRLSNSANLFLQKATDSIYKPILIWVLRWRYLVIATFSALVIAAYGYYASGRIPISFFPTVNIDMIIAELIMPDGTPLDKTTKLTRKIETAALTAVNNTQQTTVERSTSTTHLLSTVGAQPFNTRNAGNEPNRAEVVLLLKPNDVQDSSVEQIAARWEDKVGSLPESIDFHLDYRSGFTMPALSFPITAPDLETLRLASGKLKQQLSRYPGVYQLDDSYKTGKPVIEVSLTPMGQTLGLSSLYIANTIEQALNGEKAQSYWNATKEVKVFVRYPADQRQSIDDLKQVRIQTPSGNNVALGNIADFSRKQGFAVITRTNGRTQLYVSSEVDTSVANPDSIRSDVWTNFIPKLNAEYPTLSFDVSYKQHLQDETMSLMIRGGIIVLLSIYSLLAILFGSYTQPIIVLSAILFGWLGAFATHLLFGFEISISSISGMIAVSGIVLNDSLILVNQINRRISSGEDLVNAIVMGATSRVRAIFLMASTTFLAISPLLLEQSTQADFLKPMAACLAFGAVFSAGVSLLLIPSMYYVLQEIRTYQNRKSVSASNPE